MQIGMAGWEGMGPSTARRPMRRVHGCAVYDLNLSNADKRLSAMRYKFGGHFEPRRRPTDEQCAPQIRRTL